MMSFLCLFVSIRLFSFCTRALPPAIVLKKHPELCPVCRPSKQQRHWFQRACSRFFSIYGSAFQCLDSNIDRRLEETYFYFIICFIEKNL